MSFTYMYKTEKNPHSMKVGRYLYLSKKIKIRINMYSVSYTCFNQYYLIFLKINIIVFHWYSQQPFLGSCCVHVLLYNNHQKMLYNYESTQICLFVCSSIIHLSNHLTRPKRYLYSPGVSQFQFLL